MELAISDIHKRFGGVEALRGVSLTVQAGEFFAILGPSGAGKTTLLRIIAGIERPDGGRILVGGRDLTDLPVRARDTAMVFQTFALYPHFSTFENLAYPLRELKVPKPEIDRRVHEVAEMLRLTHTLARKPGTLSGGEQQRVAIARALANAPKLLLADEPTGNLDVNTAGVVFDELLRVVREQGVAALIATHNPDLAARMDRTVTLRDGRVVSA